MWYYWNVAREASQYKATWGWGEVPIGAIWCPPGSNPSKNAGEMVTLKPAHYR